MENQVYKLVAIFNQYDHCGFVAENITIADALNGLVAKFGGSESLLSQIDRIVTID